MADLKQIEDQLKRIGCNFRFWGRAEVKELVNVLLPGEVIEQCVNGSYEGGFALLAATNQRVLLVDKKPMYLTLEDVRYDMIAEVDYNHRLLNTTIYIRTPNKSLRFTAYNHARLRQFFHFVQMQVMRVRQHYALPLQQSQATQQALPQYNETFRAALPADAGQPTLDTEFSGQPTRRTHHVAPIISAYTRLPMMSRQRRFLGSRAMNTPLPSMYPLGEN